jgi:radical SAM protein with 4Fe4S-binding SPASM domain
VTDVRFAQIDPTSVCDLQCGYCVGRDWRQAHLKADHFDEFVDALPRLEYVQLQGEGEPMLAKRFWDHLARLRGGGTEIGFTTNGRHLTEDAVTRLVELGVRSIAVSVDTLDPALFRRIRGGDLQPTLAGIEQLAARRPPGMDVFTTSVMMQLTFDGFPELIQYAEDTGLSMPSCQPLQMKPSYVSHYRDLDYRTQVLTSGQLEWLGEYGVRRASFRKQRGLRTFYESVQEAAPEVRCGFVEHSVNLRFDGNMFACCFIKEDEFTLGQIGTATVLELIDSKSRHDMSSEIAAGRTPAPCAGCHVLRG